MPLELRGKKVWVAGHNGMVGRALVRALASKGCTLLTATREELDLRDQASVHRWMDANRPDVIFMAAAKVGGIGANASLPADFIYDNLTIAGNVIHAAYTGGVEKLLFLGSSCIYPKHAPQPITEDALLSSALEPTNQWYAIAKIAGLKLCQAYREQHGCNFISVMPTNLYGPHDHFDPELSHVIPSLMYKLHRAKLAQSPSVTIWGTGTAKREFLHVDDLAAACVMLMERYAQSEPINIGCREDISIKEIAQILRGIVGYEGELVFDTSKPDGAPRKLLDVSRIRALGWAPAIALQAGLSSTYAWYEAQ